MARFLLASMPGAGHVAPLRPVARALVAAGHDVHWYTGRGFRASVEDTGAVFEPMTAEIPMVREADDTRQGLAQMTDSLKKIFLDPVPGQVADLRGITARLGTEVVVADMTVLGAGAWAEVTGGLWASVGVSPLPLFSRDVPPFGLGLPPSSTPLGRLRNRALQQLVTKVVFRGVGRHDAQVRAAVGLPPRADFLMSGISPHLHLQNGVPELDYPRSDLPPHVHYVGNLADPPRTADLPPWWADVVPAGRPVVHVTQGTVANARLGDLVVPTLRALARRDVLVVATTGGADPSAVGPVPANARVARFVDHDALLPHAAAMVTNGGYGGVQKALAHGVPLVVAGTTEDKPEVAARVAWAGAGIRLRTQAPSEAALDLAVGRVLHEPSFRAAARRLAGAYAAVRPGEVVLDLLERLAGTRRPVVRA
ncbi:glycosyltransferase [Kineococcus sp. NUM-3379]